MKHATERMLDSRMSIWGHESTPASPEPRWARPLERLSDVFKKVRQPRTANVPKPERSSAELTTLPAFGRGRALREAHRSLRQQFRHHRELRRILPHLHHVEQALALQGSAALFDLPLWVLQRGLQQLGKLPWGEHPEPSLHPLQTLRLRLIETIETRSLHAAVERPDDDDDFRGSPDSQFGHRGPLSLPPADDVGTDSRFHSAVDPPPRDGVRETAIDPGTRRRR